MMASHKSSKQLLSAIMLTVTKCDYHLLNVELLFKKFLTLSFHRFLPSGHVRNRRTVREHLGHLPQQTLEAADASAREVRNYPRRWRGQEGCQEGIPVHRLLGRRRSFQGKAATETCHQERMEESDEEETRGVGRNPSKGPGE